MKIEPRQPHGVTRHLLVQRALHALAHGLVEEMADQRDGDDYDERHRGPDGDPRPTPTPERSSLSRARYGRADRHVFPRLPATAVAWVMRLESSKVRAI